MCISDDYLFQHVSKLKEHELFIKACIETYFGVVPHQWRYYRLIQQRKFRTSKDSTNYKCFSLNRRWNNKIYFCNKFLFARKASGTRGRLNVLCKKREFMVDQFQPLYFVYTIAKTKPLRHIWETIDFQVKTDLSFLLECDILEEENSWFKVLPRENDREHYYHEDVYDV